MNKDAVQHERGPRNSTLRRQMALYKDGMTSTNEVTPFQPDLILRSLSMRPPLIPPYVSDLSRTQQYIDATPYPPTINSSPNSLTTSVETIVESICETAAQLLFINIRWLRVRCEMQNFSMDDQLLLLKESWSDLFIIGVCQNLFRFSHNPLLCSYELFNNKRMINTKQSAAITAEISQFQAILFKLTNMNVDEKEYDYLRAIVLFKHRQQSNSGSTCSTNDKTFQDNNKIINLYDDTLHTLLNYINLSKPTQNNRFSDLLVVLQELKTVSCATIEEMFFKRTIGHVTIVKVMSDMYSQGKV